VGELLPLTQAVESLLADTTIRQDAERLAELVALAERAVAEEGPGEAARRYSNLGAALWRLYKHSSDVEVLRRTVDASRVAAQQVPQGHALNDGMLANLALVLTELYRAADDLAALNEALSVSAERVANAGTRGILRGSAAQLETLLGYARAHGLEGSAYRRAVTVQAEMAFVSGEQLVEIARMDRDAELLTASIELLEEALAAAVEDDPGQQAQRQRTLAYANAIRWELTTDPAALHAAIEGFMAAISLKPAAQARASCYANLALLYTQRHERAGGEPGDLDAAVMAQELAVPPDADPPKMRAWQAALQRMLWARYEATADLADLDRAIEIGRSLVPGGAVLDLSSEQVTGNLRALLVVRQAFRADPRMAEEIAGLSQALGDADGIDPEDRWGWVRTYD
jgi:hypothetical protein